MEDSPPGGLQRRFRAPAGMESPDAPSSKTPRPRSPPFRPSILGNAPVPKRACHALIQREHATHKRGALENGDWLRVFEVPVPFFQGGAASQRELPAQTLAGGACPLFPGRSRQSTGASGTDSSRWGLSPFSRAEPPVNRGFRDRLRDPHENQAMPPNLLLGLGFYQSIPRPHGEGPPGV